MSDTSLCAIEGIKLKKRIVVSVVRLDPHHTTNKKDVLWLSELVLGSTFRRLFRSSPQTKKAYFGCRNLCSEVLSDVCLDPHHKQKRRTLVVGTCARKYFQTFV